MFTLGIARSVVGGVAGAAVETFSVPVARTFSNILLVVGVMGVACVGVVVAFGASSFFFPAAFVLFAAVFFFASVSFGLGTVFVEVFIAAVFFASATTGVVPASSAITFLGRPRFLTAGGSTAVAVDMAAGQLTLGLLE